MSERKVIDDKKDYNEENTSNVVMERDDSNYKMLYEDIEKRTNGEIYIGVVGPVRSGKSTFIKRFMELFVLPNIDDEYLKRRTRDELPQGSNGKNIMTTEPKFIPNESINVKVVDNIEFKVKFIDSVGYLVDGASGYQDEEGERMVSTPWDNKPIKFSDAATIGTEKIIRDHSTIGIVMTTDGTITGIDRNAYKKGEESAIKELKSINKPFIVLLNTLVPEDEKAKMLASQMEEEYKVRVIPINALLLTKEDIVKIFEEVLYEFPLSQIDIKVPSWIKFLNDNDTLKKSLKEAIVKNSTHLYKMKDIKKFNEMLNENSNVKEASIARANLGRGKTDIDLTLEDELFYKTIEEKTGINAKNDYEIIKSLYTLSSIKKNYEKIEKALSDVENSGYGVVVPKVEELEIEEPQMLKEGNRYGVKLSARAPSIHMIRADIKAEVSPIVGTEQQSMDLIEFLTKSKDIDVKKMWDTNVFGKTLQELISEELTLKLAKMSDKTKERLGHALQRVINDGSGNLICIII